MDRAVTTAIGVHASVIQWIGARGTCPVFYGAVTVSDTPKHPCRDEYRWWIDIQTRWEDNDQYGHVNNIVYYSYFDTAANRFLIQHGLLDTVMGDLIGVVAESRCRYYAPLAFPEPVEIGLVVGHLGRSSLRYDLGVFGKGAGLVAAAGSVTHVFVDRETRRPRPMPPAMRTILEQFI